MKFVQQPKQLLILAGPSCAGKSTLITAISNQQLSSSISQRIQIENLSKLPIFEDNDISQLMTTKPEQSIILHYDLFNNYLDQNHHQNISRIIEQFDRVVVITLHVPTKILLKRIQLRVIKILIKICLKPSYFRPGFIYFGYQWDKYQRYRRGKIANEIYQEWLEFTEASWVSSHWILDSSQRQLKIQSAASIPIPFG